MGFERSWERFGVLLAGVADPVSGPRTADALEGFLLDQGRQVLRQVLRDRLDQLAAAERRAAEPVVDAEGGVHARVERGHTRGLATVFGPVRVERMAYRAPGAVNLYPADGALNLPGGLHSHTLRRLAAVEAVRGSFDQAQAAIGRMTGQRVGKRQLLGLVTGAAADITAFYAGRRAPAGRAEADLLVLTFDGKGVVMRPEGLREATARAASAAEHKLAIRLSPGEKGNRKRMAEVAAVYDAEPAPRTAAQVLARTSDREHVAGPKAENKWLTASVTDDIGAVVGEAFDQAIRRDPDRERTWICLVDGNRTQIESVQAEAARRGVTVTIVIDFIHVAEYVWGAAWSFFDKGDRDAETWVADQLTKILQGRAGHVAAAIRRRATRFGYTGTERKAADEAAKYLTAKKPHLAYDQALRQGWPIATGVIEGACRHLVKDRMDITGARWGLPGAEAVLRLRALIASGDLDEYWAFHLLKEHHRVHETRYQHHAQDYTLTA
ncbi:MAG: ISKra4 family transposase [Nocardioidaceae bacterium]